MDECAWLHRPGRASDNAVYAVYAVYAANVGMAADHMFRTPRTLR